MGRLIDADKLIKYWRTPPMNIGWDDVIQDVNNQPTVEAISKVDYEARLKADMVVMLDKIRAELIQSIQNGTLKIESGNEVLFRIIDKYKAESEPHESEDKE